MSPLVTWSVLFHLFAIVAGLTWVAVELGERKYRRHLEAADEPHFIDWNSWYPMDDEGEAA